VFVQIILKGHIPEAVARFDEAIQAMPEVLECHRITGSADYLLKIVARDHEHLDNLLMNDLMRLPAVERVHSNIVLKEIKETTRIDVMSEG
jgi:Lrp/AsnC family leucine-responsive transcriptional regulator